MKNVMKAALAVMAFAMMFSTWSLADGGADFKAKCAMCHGPDGKGDTVMGKKYSLKDLGSAEVQKQTDAELATVIAKGKKPMQAYEDKLTKEQIADVVKYIRTLKK
jgi:mono/diheme cytochrome c family protein